MNSNLRTALANVSKFNTLERALAYAKRQKYWTEVLLGDNELYWVPATNREAGILKRDGYESAEY